MTATEAAKITGLTARMIERPNPDAIDFRPSERLMSVGDALRCQLGEESQEHFHFKLKGELIRGLGKIFILRSYGPTFEIAVSRLKASKPKELASEQGAKAIAALMKAAAPKNGK